MMLSEANYFSSQTGLTNGVPLTEASVRAGSHFAPPSTNNFSGSIVTENYFFGFWKGRLANFSRTDFKADSDASVARRNLKLAQELSLIDEQEAYQLATNWLVQLNIDIASLQSKTRLNIIQWRHAPPGLSERPILLPVYQIEWLGSLPRSKRKTEMALVSATILGSRKELIEFHVLDESLVLRPPMRILNLEGLLEIQDDEFRSYNHVQKSNLITRFIQLPVSTREASK